MPEASERPELIHLDVDRRLGHEWDEWDGSPLAGGGNFDAAPRLFFGWSVLWIIGSAGIAALVLLLLAPGLALRGAGLSPLLGWGVGVAAGVLLLWWGMLAASYAIGTTLLPERLAERGPPLLLMRRAFRLGGRVRRPRR